MKNRQEFAQKLKEVIAENNLPIALNEIDRLGMPEIEFSRTIKALERSGDITIENGSIVGFGNEKDENHQFVLSEYRSSYIKEHYDSIHVVLPKGRKEIISKKAKSAGMSLSAYILSLIEKDLEEN